MANSTPVSPAVVNNSTPIKRVQLCSPVRQRTPLRQISKFVHGGVQLLGHTPGKNLPTPEFGSGAQLIKDGRTHFITPLSVNSSLQVGKLCCDID